MCRLSSNQRSMKKISLMLSIVALFCCSCNWINPAEEIPSLIKIDTISFSTVTPQGSSRQRFVDAWVYINGESVGAYELPCTFPVLLSGDVDVEVYPGIMLNGISNTRAIYPFVKSYTTSVTLNPDSVCEIKPKSSYVSTLSVEMLEDFESGGMIISASTLSDTTIGRTSDPADVYEGSYSGMIVLDQEHRNIDVKSVTPYVLPQDGAYNFMELHFKSDVTIAIGVIVNTTQSVYEDVLYLNATDTWKKIYVNLTPIINRSTSAVSFYPFIRSYLSDGITEGRIYLDNIKLLNAAN